MDSPRPKKAANQIIARIIHSRTKRARIVPDGGAISFSRRQFIRLGPGDIAQNQFLRQFQTEIFFPAATAWTTSTSKGVGRGSIAIGKNSRTILAVHLWSGAWLS